MFRCLVIRHAAAETSAASGLDADRRVSAAGHEDMRQAARGLARIVPGPDIIATSPYARARASAKVLADAFDRSEALIEPVEALAAGAMPEALLGWIRVREGRLVMLVGHEPDLGRFVSMALAGTERSFYPMHVGDACLIEFPSVPRAGNATLEWAVERSQLALIGATEHSSAGD